MQLWKSLVSEWCKNWRLNGDLVSVVMVEVICFWYWKLDFSSQWKSGWFGMCILFSLCLITESLVVCVHTCIRTCTYVCITLLKHNSMSKSRFYQLYAVHSGKEVIEFWCTLCWESFSNLRNFVQKYIYWCASTYICEPSFSVMKVIKNKQKWWLKNGNMQNFTTTNLKLDSNSFAANKRQQNLVMKWWEFLNVNSKFCLLIVSENPFITLLM